MAHYEESNHIVLLDNFQVKMEPYLNDKHGVIGSRFLKFPIKLCQLVDLLGKNGQFQIDLENRKIRIKRGAIKQKATCDSDNKP